MYQSHSILWVRCFCAWLLPNSTWTLGIHRSTTLDEPRVWWNKWFKKPWVLGYNMKHWVLHHIHPYIHLFTYNVYICIHMNLTKLHHKFEWILILSTPQKKTAFLSLVPSKKTTLNFHHQHLKKKNNWSMSSSKQELFVSQTRFFELGVCTWSHGVVKGSEWEQNARKKHSSFVYGDITIL